MPSALPIEARSGPVTLAGTLWQPDGEAVATVLMHPGSGPSNRDNDVFFPQVRAVLLEAGIAAASFDKRGVGGSTGDWREAGIVEQAADATAALDAVRAAGAPEPIGLFGHSQGGWVVIEAAASGTPAAFVVTNGGPGVSPAMQDRFALANAGPAGRVRSRGRRAGAGPRTTWPSTSCVEACPRRRPTPSSGHRPTRSSTPTAWRPTTPPSGSCSGGWSITIPAPRCAGSRVPVLALFGADDEITPVAASVEAFRARCARTC